MNPNLPKDETASPDASVKPAIKTATEFRCKRKLTNEQIGQAVVENLNRNVLAEHEADLAELPPEIRASRTPEEWLATPALVIMKMARDAKNRGNQS